MYYNTHIHTFRDIDVPERFLPLSLVRILATKPGFNLVAKILNDLNPFSDRDVFNRYLKFIETGKLGSQKKIFEACKDQYPGHTSFVILPMDMAFMRAGKVPRPYEEQLEELGKLQNEYPQIFPFVHVDPRRPDVFDLLKKCVEEWDFKGVKLYPPLGYFPYDDRLDPVYGYCEEKNLPVIAHCSPYNMVHFKGKRKELVRLLSQSKGSVDISNKSKKVLCAQFADPANYLHVYKKFKKLKICLAHFGSSFYWDEYFQNPHDPKNWFLKIKDMIGQNKNVYTDISFTLNNKRFFPLLKILLEDDSINSNILFGTDYYMVETKTEERRFGIELRAFLGEKLFRKIAVDNPRKFL